MITIAFPHKPGMGGPGSFQKRFEDELVKRGHKIIYSTNQEKADVVFVVGGTKKLFWLLKNKFNKTPIIYRLDGINWIHRKREGSLSNFIVPEIQNLLSKIIHGFLSDYIIYQSLFVKEWWISKGWRVKSNFQIINNGINLTEFRPFQTDKSSKIELICLEGLLDYTPYAIDLINFLHQKIDLKMKVYGGIKFHKERIKLDKKVDYKGKVDMKDLPLIYQNKIYLSLDINAACPNTVAEALASGSPVVGFDTGALKELVQKNSGIIVDYGGNPWKLEKPNYQGLIKAIDEISNNYKYYSDNARKIAEERYNIENVVDRYLEVILKVTQRKNL